MGKNKFAELYRELEPLYRSFALRLTGLLEELLRMENISFAQIEYRAKTLESFVAKIERKGYENPLKEIKDLCGLRVVTYYHDDVKRIADLINREFDIDAENSLDKSKELGVDEFGYRSLHLIVSMRPPRKGLVEWKTFSDFTAEIQVRSVLQHAWAAISHKLDYKKASQAPEPLRRKLFRLSALLELADEEFVGIRESGKAITLSYQEDVNKGDLNIPLDLDSLRTFLDERDDDSFWIDLGKSVGMEPVHPSRKAPEKEIQRLLAALQAANVETIRQFDDLLPSLKTEGKNLLQEFANRLKGQEQGFKAIAVDILTVLILLKYSVDLPTSLSFREEFTDVLKKIVPVKKAKAQKK